jgi:UDP-N-acetylmuramyl pentapeptide phosphotransferase/UDP-N-acetylglucosamine-1-phosphate transferase
MPQLIAPLTAFAAALFVVWWLARGRFSELVLDHPNPRSLHQSPVPRTGGLGLHAGFLLAAGIVAPALPTVLWLAFAALLLISFLDDARGIAPLLRLAAHLAAAALFSVVVVYPGQGMFAAVIATLTITWMANLYNFMDGSDGLAGGMAAIGFSIYSAAAWLAGSADFALLNLSLATASIAFLIFNWHPARIFMGDAGSVPLGFLAAAFGIIGWLHHTWTWWFPVLAFASFIADATVTLARRIVKRDRVWEAHRDHYYQRLVRMGWGHRRTAVWEYIVMVVSGLVALIALALPVAMQMAVLVAVAAGYLVLIALIEARWSRTAGNGK